MNSATDYPVKQITQVRAEEPYTLYVTRQDGQEIELDLTPLIETREAFWRLKNFRYFRNVDIDPLGGIFWSEGEDISPTKIFHYAK
ncbi:MAG: DUF2442 domain-containing protein [Methylococcaceae bacterium]